MRLSNRVRVAVCLIVSACGASDDPIIDPPVPDTSAEVVLELGHVKPIEAIFRTGDRLLSRDSIHHWVLWDVPNRRALASGDQNFNWLALAASTMIDQNADDNTIEVRTIATGAVTARIPRAEYASVGLSVDGSYVWLASRDGLQAWSSTGTQLFDIAGDFTRAVVYAAPRELRVCADPVNIHLVETVQIPTGDVATTPFSGTFVRWFDTGERFVTAVDTTAWVYTAAGAQLAFAELPTARAITGQGDHVWTDDGQTLRIYLATDLSAPLASFALVNATPISAGDAIALVGDGLELITLGPTITRGAQIPIRTTAFGGTGSGPWAIGTVEGFVVDRDDALGPAAERRSLSAGVVTGLAGAPNGTAVLSTASGLLVLTISGNSATIERTLPYHSDQLALTADGATLALTDRDPAGSARAVQIVTLSDGSLRHELAGSIGFSLSPAGDAIALAQADGSVTYTDLDGGAVEARGPNEGTILFSPDGTRVAATKLAGDPPAGVRDATTRLYRAGQLTGAVPGVALGWLDQDRVLAATFSWVHSLTLATDTIYDPSGAVIAELPPSTSSAVTPLGDDQVYVPNGVIELSSGLMIWQGQPAQLGAVVGPHEVIYVSGAQVRRGTLPY